MASQSSAMPNQAPPRRFAVVLNHTAGAFVGQANALETMQAAFATHNVDAEFVPMDAGDLPARVALARDAGADAVVVIGGDGSVACAAQALVGSNTPLGILPFGTMNLLARDLGIPTGDLPGAIRVLSEFHTTRVDVGEVNGRVFLCGCMVGLPTRLGQVREAGRGRPFLRSWARFFAAALRLFRTFRPLRLTLRTHGRTWRVRTPAILLTVNPLSDNTGRQMGRNRLDGGVLAAYVFSRLKLIDALRIGLPALIGRWSGDEAVDEFEAAQLSISSRRPSLRVMNDGEPLLLETPLEFRVRPAALVVLSPAPAT
jgi:diacylglycerol kinase family enzyme